MTRFYAEQHLPRGSADSVWVVVDNEAPRGNGIIVTVDPNALLTDERDSMALAKLVAVHLNAQKFKPIYAE